MPMKFRDIILPLLKVVITRIMNSKKISHKDLIQEKKNSMLDNLCERLKFVKFIQKNIIQNLIVKLRI